MKKKKKHQFTEERDMAPKLLKGQIYNYRMEGLILEQ